MTGQQVAQLALAWPALVATVVAVLSPAGSRWSWAAAGLLLSGWLAVTESPGIGAVIAAAIVAGGILEGPGVLAKSDFTRTTRRLGMLVAGLAAAVVVSVRLAQVDATQAPYVFPVLATGIVSLVALFAAAEETEMNRAARVLLLVAVVGWVVATAAAEPGAAVIAAAVLPLLGLTARVHVSSPTAGAP